MKRPVQLRLCLHDELVVDNFAGGGGASLGIEQAIGRPVDIAINHDPEALAMHEVNHPHTRHLCENIMEVDPRQATGGKPVVLAWFSPDCKHFSKAKGGKPVSKKIRGLAWVVIRWAAAVRPRVIILENVEEFQEWGPLTQACDKKGRPRYNADGSPVMLPCPYNKGKIFHRWKTRLENLGYVVDYRELRACDYGAPTIRKRLFLIARCDGRPIVWPEATHGSGLEPFRTAAECIDWSLPCPSIFTRKRPLAEATMRRIAKGIQRYVLDAAEPFIVNLTHGGRLEELKEPFRTITAAHRGEKAMVVPYVQTYYGDKRPGGDFRGVSMEGRLPTQTTENRHALVTAFLAKHYGGVVGHQVNKPLGTVTTIDHHSLVATHLVRHFGQSIGQTANSPAPTITSGGQGKTGLVTSHLIKLRGTCQHGQDARQPMPTVTAGGLHIGEVRAFLLKYYGTDQDPQLRAPLHTITTKDRFGLVTVAGEEYQIADIGMRMLAPRELFRAQGFPDSYVIDTEFNGKRLTKTAQVRMCGNSVSPYVARALVDANVVLSRQEAAA